MTIDTAVFQSSVLFAACGALGIKLLELAELKNIPKNERPDIKEFLYWLPFVIMPVLGGGLAYMYIMSDVLLKPVIAVNIGVSAPLILRTMASSAVFSSASIEPEKGA